MKLSLLKSIQTNPTRIFICYIFCHFIVWSLLPLMRGVIPLDSLEAITWGKSLVFITDKHPPLSGFIAYYFYLLCGRIPESVYVLSQIFVVCGLIYIYNLARLFLAPKSTLLATLLLDTILYYNFTSIEYNVNVILLFIYPATAFHFYKALQTESSLHWILVGIYAGLGVLDKYYIFMLLGAIFCYLCYIRAWKRLLISKGFYLGLFMFGIIIAPHIYWVIQSDFVTFQYFLRRGGGATQSADVLTFICRHFWYPIYFFLSQFILAIPALVIFVIYRFKYKPQSQANTDTNATIFINFMCFGPLILTMLVSVISGSFLLPMWGTPLFFAFGIWLFYRFGIAESSLNVGFFIRSIVLVGILIIIAYVGMMIATPSLRKNLDSTSFNVQVQDFWDKKTHNAPLYYTGGDMWLGSIAAIYAESTQKHKIRTFIAMNPKENFWITQEILNDMAQKGILIFGTLADFEHYKAMYPNFRFQTKEIEIKSKNLMGTSKSETIYIGIAKGNDPQ